MFSIRSASSFLWHSSSPAGKPRGGLLQCWAPPQQQPMQLAARAIQWQTIRSMVGGQQRPEHSEIRREKRAVFEKRTPAHAAALSSYILDKWLPEFASGRRGASFQKLQYDVGKHRKKKISEAELMVVLQPLQKNKLLRLSKKKSTGSLVIQEGPPEEKIMALPEKPFPVHPIPPELEHYIPAMTAYIQDEWLPLYPKGANLRKLRRDIAWRMDRKKSPGKIPQKDLTAVIVKLRDDGIVSLRRRSTTTRWCLIHQNDIVIQSPEKKVE